jgi:MFS family permease
MRSRTTLLILGAAQFVMVLDTTVMNVSISQVVADLDTTVTKIQTAITAYTLVMAAFMLTGAKLGDILGRRRAFSIGIAVYGVGSLITALSPNVTVLLIGWSGVEGLGAVMVIPAIAALTSISYTGAERARAFGLLGGIAGAGVAVGPLIGGAVTTLLSWRVVFASETLVVIVILFLVRHLAEDRPRERPKLDLVGTLLSALGLGLVVFGILKISTWGLFKPTGALTINGTRITPLGLSIVPFLILAGGAFIALFARWEQRLVREGRVPLLAPDLLKVPQLRAGLSSVLSQYLILAGTFFVLPLFLQLVLEEDALHTGIKILPISITMMLGALAGPRIAERIPQRTVVRIGMGVLLVSVPCVMLTVASTLDSVQFAISLAGFGLGIGLVISQLGNIVMSSVPASRSSEAGGVQGAAQNLGQSLGTALIGAVLLTGMTVGFHGRVNVDAAIPSTVKQQLVQGSEDGVAVVSRSQARGAAEQAGLPPDQVDAVVADYEEAQIEALRRALFCASLFVFVGLWFARLLPDETIAAGAQEDEPEGAQPPGTESIPAGAV